MSLALPNNEITEVEYKSRHILPIVLEGDAKVEHVNKWRTYLERTSCLEKQHILSFYMIRCQCMKFIPYKTKHDPYWDNNSESYDPLTLLKLIQKNILSQTKDQCCYATVYNPACALYGFNQHNLTNEQFYDIFNTKVDVG